jgi:hypothetical protein
MQQMNKRSQIKLVLAVACGMLIAFSSCKKNCKTCVPHQISNGVLATTPDPYADAVEECDQRIITAYDGLTTLTDWNNDTIKFVCK